MALSMVRGDSKDIPFVVLGKPVSLSGTWTWGGTLTVLSTDTSGVVAGDWIRLPVIKGAVTYGLFKIVTVNANTSVVIQNPSDLTIPSGTGAEGASPIDLTGAVVKFTMTKILDQPNASAAAHKTSYVDPLEIEMTDPAAGAGTVHLLASDTCDEAPGDYTWDVETTRKGTAIVMAGTVTVTLAGTTITFSDPADVALLRKGDIILPAGLPGNDTEVTVEATPSDDAALLPTQVRTDYALFVAESGVAITAYRGNRKTPIIDTMTIVRDATL